MSLNDPDTSPRFREHWNLILRDISAALEAVDPAQVQLLVEAMLKAGTLFYTGVGRVALSLQAMVKRLNHLGFGAWFAVIWASRRLPPAICWWWAPARENRLSPLPSPG